MRPRHPTLSQQGGRALLLPAPLGVRAGVRGLAAGLHTQKDVPLPAPPRRADRSDLHRRDVPELHADPPRPRRPDRGARRRTRHRRRRGSRELRHEYGLDQPLWKQFLQLRGAGRARRSRRSPWSRAKRCGTSSRRCSRRPSNWRSARSCSPSSIGLPLGVIAAVQARLDVRLRGDGRVRHRRLHADLLVGADDDPGVLGGARLDAGVGAHRDAILRRAVVRLSC